jgi:hypothetical protein
VTSRTLLFAALLVLAVASPALAFRITDPWPDPAQVQGVRREIVAFPSSDPFVPGDPYGQQARRHDGSNPGCRINSFLVSVSSSPQSTAPAVRFADSAHSSDVLYTFGGDRLALGW